MESSGSESLARPQTSPAGTAPVKRVRVNGTDLAYIEAGAGSPVVLVHGMAADFRTWDTQLPAVAGWHRVIVPSLRYHYPNAWAGDGSDYSNAQHAADVAALVGALDLGPVHLVGHSNGGMVAVLVALDHPELVRSLVLVEGSVGSLIAALPAAVPLLEERREVLGRMAAATKAGEWERALRLLTDYVSGGEGAFDGLPEDRRRAMLENARTLVLVLAAPQPRPIACDDAARLSMPVLVVGGERGIRYYSLINEALARCVPRGRPVTVPDAGHTAMLDNPDRFNAVLLDFLASA